MANSSRELFQAFTKKGQSEREAFFAVIDHFNQQHWHDRNRYDARIKELESKISRLEGRSV